MFFVYVCTNEKENPDSCKCGDRHDLRANEWIKECKSVCMCWMSVVCCVCLCMLKTWKKNMMIKIMAMVIVNRDQ